MKNIVFPLAILIFLAACSKDKKVTPKTPPLLDVSGSWTLYSDENNRLTSGPATADKYPCMASMVATFLTDSTSYIEYTGDDICYIRGQSEVAGAPATDPIQDTWQRTGNDLYEAPNQHIVISTENNKLILTWDYAYTWEDGKSYIDRKIYHKQ